MESQIRLIIQHDWIEKDSIAENDNNTNAMNVTIFSINN